MRKSKFFGALILFLLPLVAWVGLANAQSFRSGNSVTVPANETVNSALFSSGRTLDIAGTVDGDVFCAGMNITISGTVRGDVICAAQTITLSGRVEGDVRLAGQTITLSGRIDGSATVASNSFSLGSNSSISRDLAVAATDVVLNGSVGRDVALAADTATLNGQVGRNVNAKVETMILRGQANVRGGMYYSSNKDAVLDEGAQVAGETKRTELPESKGAFETPFVTGFGFVLYLIASLMILSLALVLLFPAAIHEASSIGLSKPFKAGLIGFGSAIAVPVMVIVLSLTILGIPLAILLLMIWVLVLFLSGPVFSYFVGRLILQKSANPFLIMALGSFSVLVLLFIPILGIFVWVIAMWMGAGMLILEIMRRTPRPKYEVATATSTASPTTKARATARSKRQ